jgi:predicted amidohydrolase YtcJ
MKYAWFILIFLVSSACMKGKKVDLIVHNAKIHCMDDQNTVEDAMAIKDGKIVEVGPERQILNKYYADQEVDAKQKGIYPGFTDAHTHMFSLAKQNLGVDLTDCKSMKEVVNRIKDYLKLKKRTFVIGRGWDQTRWKDDQMPTKEMISKAFPTIPVALYRIDGHALLVNEALLTSLYQWKTLIFDGPYETGLFIDNDMSIPEAKMQDFSSSEYEQELLKIQRKLFAFGVTGVHEAGLMRWQVALLKQMVEQDKLSLDIYAMLTANEENYQYAKKHGHMVYKNLSIRSFKLYMDGALGSRGALLKAPYADMKSFSGQQLTSHNALSMWIERSLALDYQLNTHAIGDQGNQLVLNAYKRAFEQNPDHRWRIEHAQVVDPSDMHLFGTYAVFPSVQPTHATSDHDWAQRRLGKERLKGAYAYQSLYNQFGMLALGTDFPVEQINPFLTLRAAVLRMNSENKPLNGYLVEEALDLNTTLKGMTIWPQFAAFSETKRGMLIQGMEATFFICEKPITENNIPENNRSVATYVRGMLRFDSVAY